MKHFDYRFFSFLSLLLLFGLVVDGYSQDRSCLTCNPNTNSSANRFDLGLVSFTDIDGNPIDLDNCPDPNNIYITITYNTPQARPNVFFVSNLEITTNSGPDVGNIESEIFDFSLGNLAATGGDFLRHTVQVFLPLDYDCQNQTARLTDIRIHWSAPGNANRCGGLNYPSGQCSSLGTSTRVITVDGFFYSFGVSESCFEENDLTFRAFVLTNVAGGNGTFDVIWTVTKNGVPRTDPTRRLPDGLFIVEPAFPNDVIEVSVIVRDSDGLTMPIPPSEIRAVIPEPFEVSIQVLPNVGDVTPSPNGSIRLSNLDPSKTFLYEWLDENNLPVPGDPTNLTGLGEGTYFLYMTDEAGVVRCFSRTITFVPTPVIYANLALGFNSSQRSVNFSWSTTKEWEASHYEIERAANGNQFEKIGEVKAAGWSDQLTEYLFEDKMLPLTGGNLLYRLKQVDFNGDFEYSKVLSVRVPGMQFTSGVWRAFPNPTDGSSLRISLLDASQYNNEPLTFRLIHPTSQTEAISVATEKEMNDVLADLSKRMPKGVFVVEIQWGQKVEHIKVIKK